MDGIKGMGFRLRGALWELISADFPREEVEIGSFSQARPELNGLVGVLTYREEEKGRWKARRARFEPKIGGCPTKKGSFEPCVGSKPWHFGPKTVAPEGFSARWS